MSLLEIFEKSNSDEEKTPDVLYKEAKSLFERGRYRKAADTVHELLVQMDPINATETEKSVLSYAWFLAGEIETMRRNKVEAIGNFTESLSYNPENAEAYHRIACLQTGMGNLDALKNFDNAIEINPINFTYWYNKADAIIKLDDKIQHDYFKKANGDKVESASMINFDSVIIRITEAIKCMHNSIKYCKWKYSDGDRMDLVAAYNTRGRLHELVASMYGKNSEHDMYNRYKNLETALNDYAKAVELFPKETQFYKVATINPFVEDFVRADSKMNTLSRIYDTDALVKRGKIK